MTLLHRLATRVLPACAAAVAAACGADPVVAPLDPGGSTPPAVAPPPNAATLPAAWNDEGMWASDPDIFVGSRAVAFTAAFASALDSAGDQAVALRLRQLPYMTRYAATATGSAQARARASLLQEARGVRDPSVQRALTPGDAPPSNTSLGIHPLIFSTNALVAVQSGSTSGAAGYSMDFAGSVGIMDASVTATRSGASDVTWKAEARKLGWENSHNYFAASMPLNLPKWCGYTVNLTVAHQARNYLFIPINPIVDSGLFEYGTRATAGSSGIATQPECPCNGAPPGPPPNDQLRAPAAPEPGLGDPSGVPLAGGPSAPSLGAVPGIVRPRPDGFGRMRFGFSRVVAHAPQGQSGAADVGARTSAAAPSPAGAAASHTRLGSAAIFPSSSMSCEPGGGTGGGGGGSGGGIMLCYMTDYFDGDGNFLYRVVHYCWQAQM